MPSIDVAMARSLRGSTFEILRDAVARGISSELARRSITSDAEQKITDIKTALSSWDNCMSVTWCKWPVIGIIIFVGLIIFSIVWCIVRCCCCGLSCCCSCCQCLKCCGNCCGCCDPPGDRKHKHLDDPYAPDSNHHGYRSEPPMQPGFQTSSALHSTPPQASSSQFAPQTQHWQNEPPKYAEFEVRGAKHDEDALPEMPTMEKAEITTKVGLHDDVELDQLKKSPAQEQQYGMMNGTPSTMPQGRSPYSQQQGNNSGFFNQHGQAPDPYSPIDKGYGYHNNQGDGYGHDQTYAASAIGNGDMGQNSPAHNYNGYGQNPVDRGYGQQSPVDHGYGHQSPIDNGYGHQNPADRGYGQSHGDYDNGNHGYNANQAPGPSRTPAPQGELNGYGFGVAPSRSPAPQNAYDDYHQSARKTPAIQDSYGYSHSEQAYGNHQAYDSHQTYDNHQTYDSHQNYDNHQAQDNRQAYDSHQAYSPVNAAAPEPQYGSRPVPQRQYPQQDPPRSPLNNNAGFDFNSGNSRPGQSPTTESYPGYKAYQP